MTDLQEKVFEIGSASHFTDTCSFYFECDCCSGNLIFNANSTFYYEDYCLADISVTTGQYDFANNVLSLHYSGYCVSKEYNWENEVDSSVIDYFMTDTTIKPITVQFLPTMCNNKIKLVGKEENGEFAIETKSDYQTAINFLKEDGFIERFEK